jgi:glycosyltransferase involved in cell wall biosynthesis
MNRVLLVAYHFPPFTGSSGVHRALSFSTHLDSFGWEPIVLTAHPRAYETRSDEMLHRVSKNVRVIRAPAWDTKQHFAIRGRYPTFMARPDRWRWWWPGAVAAGIFAIRKYRPRAIWSTYPIATAHRIGTALARFSGLPLIADFRDPMAQDDYPEDPITWRCFERIERRAIATADYSTFTTAGSVRLYQQRYPEFSDRMRLLENGFDEDVFDGFAAPDEPLNPGRLTLLHSGLVYPNDRDPTHLFDALAALRKRARKLFERLVVRFRASGQDALLHELVIRHGLGGAVEILPPIEYREAVAEMCRADGLLILQGRSCNTQIPAKFYEYLRAGRPMLVFGDPAGDTAAAARSSGISANAALENTPGISAVLEAFIEDPAAGTLPSTSAVQSASRRGRTAELAALLDEVVAAGA